MRLASFFFVASALAACAAQDDDAVGTSADALGTCARAGVTATAGLNLRASPTTAAEVVGQMPFESEVDVLGRSDDGAWARVRFGSTVAWASAEWLRCVETPTGPCATGKARHAFVHVPSADVLAEPRPGARAIVALPYGQKAVPQATRDGFTQVVVATLDGRADQDGHADRVTGWVASSAVKQSTRCADDGLLTKDAIGARFLLGQASISRAAGTDNAKNMVLGLDRVDGAIVGSGARFNYLEYVANDFKGVRPCGSDADCDADNVCHQRGLCGSYLYGIGTGGDELWGSGVCGTATAIHRAALDGSLLPTAYTNHDHFISSYSYVGIDAEVWWDHGAPGATGQHYRFLNDTGGSLVLIGGAHARGGDIRSTVQIWGTRLDDRYSEHEVVDLGGGHVQLRRTLTRLGDGARFSPAFGVEGTGDIRRVAQSSGPAADGKTASREDWRIDSFYDGEIRLPEGKILSRRHPDRPE